MSSPDFGSTPRRIEDTPEYKEAFVLHVTAQVRAREQLLEGTQILPPQPAAQDGVLFADRKRAEHAARRNTVMRRVAGLLLLGGAAASQTVPVLEDFTHTVGANLYHLTSDQSGAEQPVEEQE